MILKTCLYIEATDKKNNNTSINYGSTDKKVQNFSIAKIHKYRLSRKM